MKILLPALSPTMETGNLVKWLVEEGQKVNSGDLIAEIETDKATMELEAPDDGTINQLVVSEGTENIKVNSLIAILDVEGEDLENDVTPSDEIVTKEQPKKDVDSSISMNSIINSSEENNSNWTEVEITMREALNQAIEEEMSSFGMAEDVIELLGAKYNVMEEDVPTILMAMANNLMDSRMSSSDIPPAGQPLSGDQMDKLARDI